MSTQNLVEELQEIKIYFDWLDNECEKRIDILN